MAIRLRPGGTQTVIATRSTREPHSAQTPAAQSGRKQPSGGRNLTDEEASPRPEGVPSRPPAAPTTTNAAPQPSSRSHRTTLTLRTVGGFGMPASARVGDRHPGSVRRSWRCGIEAFGFVSQTRSPRGVVYQQRLVCGYTPRRRQDPAGAHMPGRPPARAIFRIASRCRDFLNFFWGVPR